MPLPRTVALILPFAAALALLGCSSASSTLGNTAATSSPAQTSAAPAQTASTSVTSSAVPSAAVSSGAVSSAAPSSAAPASAVSGTAPPSGSRVYFAESGEINGTVLYEPACKSGCQLSGDGTSGLYNMTWPVWNGTEAVGTGTEKLDDCNPNCAAGTLHAVAVRMTFTKPVKATCDGTTHLYWTRMTFVWPNGLPAAFSGQNAPANPFSYPEIGTSGACA
jgi:hypothetical protein